MKLNIMGEKIEDDEMADEKITNGQNQIWYNLFE